MPDASCRELGHVTGPDGTTLHVGTDGGDVAIYVGAWLSADGICLPAEAREDFQRLFMAAEREAEAHG